MMVTVSFGVRTLPQESVIVGFTGNVPACVGVPARGLPVPVVAVKPGGGEGNCKPKGPVPPVKKDCE